MNIDWNNLNLKQYTALELLKIRRMSFDRYAPPNMHSILLFFPYFILMLFSIMLLFHIKPMLIGFNMYPTYHVGQFWFMEASFLVISIILFFIYKKLDNKSRIRWEEMEAIRKNIDAELEKR